MKQIVYAYSQEQVVFLLMFCNGLCLQIKMHLICGYI